MKNEEPTRLIKLLVLLLVPIVYYVFLTDVAFAYDNDFSSEQLSFLEEKQSVKEFLRESINDKIVVNIYVDAYSMELNNNFVGYVSSEEESERVLKILEGKYANKLGENKQNIQSINVSTDLQLDKKSVRLSDINTIDEIVENVMLLNQCKEEPLIEVEIITINKELIDVEPTVMVINDSDIFIGETSIKDGATGKKEVVKKKKFINGKYEDDDIIDENILVQPIEKIIYRGTKNPVTSGVVFLQHPTRGGVITSNFGSRGSGSHRGIDIGVPTGTSIGAACDGVVRYVGYDNVYGNMVIIKHSDELETAYAHASEIVTSVGSVVKKGETIAKSGNTGRSTGPHLHFELRLNGNAINPKDFIDGL